MELATYLATFLPIYKFKVRGDTSPGDVWDFSSLLCPIRCSKFDLFQLWAQHCNFLLVNCSSFLKQPEISWHEKVPVCDKFFNKLRLLSIAKENPFHPFPSSACLLHGRKLRMQGREQELWFLGESVWMTLNLQISKILQQKARH